MPSVAPRPPLPSRKKSPAPIRPPQGDTATPLPLWPRGAPGSAASAPGGRTLTPYLAASEKAPGASLLVIAGGAYWHYGEHEAGDYARWLSGGLGIDAYVLHYRLGTQGHRHLAMIQDAVRGLRLARRLAREAGRDPARVGVIGSSAGGHLAATLLTRPELDEPTSERDAIDRESATPALALLCYPVITMLEIYAHQGSREGLVGPTPEPPLLADLSPERHVRPGLCPCFLWHTVEDQAVPLENSLMMVSALRRAQVPFEFHLYERGAHGLGLGRGATRHPWAKAAAAWLAEHGFASSGSTPEAPAVLGVKRADIPHAVGLRRPCRCLQMGLNVPAGAVAGT